MPVVKVDGHPIQDGKPGPVSQRLLQAYIESRLATAI
jgi:D-alanine transaminase